MRPGERRGGFPSLEASALTSWRRAAGGSWRKPDVGDRAIRSCLTLLFCGCR